MDDHMPMVSSLTGVINSLLDKLTAPELQEIRHSLESMKKNLVSFANQRVQSMLVQQWMKQARELAYDIEDWVDDLLIGSTGQIQPALRSLNVAIQVEEFKVLIHGMQERCARYGLLSKVTIISDDDLASFVPSKATIDWELLWGEKPCLIALSNPENELIRHLIDGERKLKVVSVVGIGGIGKTTLATEVYRKVQSQFECRAFIHVGRNPSVWSTLMNILCQLDPKSYYWGYDEKQVVTKLWEFLGKKRYLIVTDDIWTVCTWSAISCVLPDNNLGSRILATTRINDVASSCSIQPTDFVLSMKALSDCDSKTLFRSRISVPKEDWQFDLKNYENLMEVCGGTPLAITVAAGLLATNFAEPSHQSNMLEKAIFSVGNQHSKLQGVEKILHISYGDLSLPAKSCFMYLNIFPENHTIRKDCLIWRWVAEGFIPESNEESSWEIGARYFNELIIRRLVQPVFSYDDDQAVGCTVHGVILDFIASLSGRENFVMATEDLRFEQFPCDVIRRLSLNCRDQGEVDTRDDITMHLSRVRSLTVFF
ncbi:unnamed protein product [Urochloa decumbens]|uniref:Uncharacterized protein n=1 Tax=Urochloa decumbens TaxID=240449 RepID=A0ABC9AMV2_9POAL